MSNFSMRFYLSGGTEDVSVVSSCSWFPCVSYSYLSCTSAGRSFHEIYFLLRISRFACNGLQRMLLIVWTISWTARCAFLFVTLTCFRCAAKITYFCQVRLAMIFGVALSACGLQYSCTITWTVGRVFLCLVGSNEICQFFFRSLPLYGLNSL